MAQEPAPDDDHPAFPNPAGPGATLVQQSTYAESFQGPIPPPGLLAQYNDVLPGAAERLIAMAEAQARHRMELERLALVSEIRRSYWGLGAGFVVAMTLGIGSVFVVLDGHEVAGTILGTADLAGLVGVFVYGTQSRRRERQEQARMMAASDSHERS